LFVGGFCWVLGDLFQQYAAKYIGIGRGIPLSNTNQLWGLAWGALVFGELAGQSRGAQVLVIGGSLLMIAGSLAISLAEAPAAERASWKVAMERECRRYGLDSARVAAALRGEDPLAQEATARSWWEIPIVAGALGIFAWAALGAKRQAISIDMPWLAVLSGATLLLLVVCGAWLWRRTRFS
jgi:drug/metabolite transporter (DMT)-like permease